MKTEYKVVPAPEKAPKVRGLKGPALFARAMEDVMNELAQDGWTYLRADTLPQEERSGLTNKTTTYRNLLVFQRITPDDAAEGTAEGTAIATTIQPATPAPVATPNPTPEPEDEVTNIWASSPDDEDDKPSAALVADRQSQRVDL